MRVVLHRSPPSWSRASIFPRLTLKTRISTIERSLQAVNGISHNHSADGYGMMSVRPGNYPGAWCLIALSAHTRKSFFYCSLNLRIEVKKFSKPLEQTSQQHHRVLLATCRGFRVVPAQSRKFSLSIGTLAFQRHERSSDNPCCCDGKARRLAHNAARLLCPWERIGAMYLPITWAIT
jgi:hypothetical protein